MFTTLMFSPLCNFLFFQDLVELCPGVTGNITQYQIRFQSGSLSTTQNVNIVNCTAGRCNHTFEPPSNPPSSYDSVSVAAENVVGVGAARTCTTQTISELSLSLCHVLYKHTLTMSVNYSGLWMGLLATTFTMTRKHFHNISEVSNV